MAWKYASAVERIVQTAARKTEQIRHAKTLKRQAPSSFRRSGAHRKSDIAGGLEYKEMALIFLANFPLGAWTTQFEFESPLVVACDPCVGISAAAPVERLKITIYNKELFS